jgi:hypothetical protein
MMVAYILNCFSGQNWAESEKTLLPSLLKRFTTSKEKNPILITLLNEVVMTIVTGGISDAKIRNL